MQKIYIGDKAINFDGEKFRDKFGAILGDSLVDALKNMDTPEFGLFGTEYIHIPSMTVLASQEEGQEVAFTRLKTLKKSIKDWRTKVG